MDDVALAVPPVSDQCPKGLRVVLERWKQGKASNAELIEASYYAQLDLLQEYRRLPLPTPPEEVREYRAMPSFEQRAVSTAVKAKMGERYYKFFQEEEQIKRLNEDHLRTLQELLDWAKGKKMQEQIVRAIEAQLAQHQDVTIDEPEPLAV